MQERRVFIVAGEAPPRTRQNIYPKPFAGRVAGRLKRPLGDLFGLKNFGVNLTRLEPGAETALRHHHSRQDELVYVLEGNPILITGAGEFELEPGMCAGFPAASGDGHHLVNHSQEPVILLEVGDRTEGDRAEYPDDDLAFAPEPRNKDGSLAFVHKDGTPYER
jgi:uncharacterized cupin superfamily protein